MTTEYVGCLPCSTYTYQNYMELIQQLGAVEPEYFAFFENCTYLEQMHDVKARVVL